MRGGVAGRSLGEIGARLRDGSLRRQRRELLDDRRHRRDRTARQLLQRRSRDSQQTTEPGHRKTFSSIRVTPSAGERAGGGPTDAQDARGLFDGQIVRRLRRRRAHTGSTSAPRQQSPTPRTPPPRPHNRVPCDPVAPPWFHERSSACSRTGWHDPWIQRGLPSLDKAPPNEPSRASTARSGKSRGRPTRHQTRNERNDADEPDQATTTRCDRSSPERPMACTDRRPGERPACQHRHLQDQDGGEVAFAAAISEQRRGAWVAPENGRVTLADYALNWLDTRLTSRGEPLRPKTKELYEGFLRLHILPSLGAVPLGHLTTARVRSWHTRLLTTGPGASSVAKCYRLLRTVLSTAVEDGLIVSNPCSIKGAGIEPSDERTLPTLAQVNVLADSDSAAAPRARAPCRVQRVASRRVARTHASRRRPPPPHGRRTAPAP